MTSSPKLASLEPSQCPRKHHGWHPSYRARRQHRTVACAQWALSHNQVVVSGSRFAGWNLQAWVILAELFWLESSGLFLLRALIHEIVHNSISVSVVMVTKCLG